MVFSIKCGLPDKKVHFCLQNDVVGAPEQRVYEKTILDHTT